MPQPSRASATKKHVILFLAANPHDTGRLALDREARSIHLELKRSGYRERFEFVTRWAVEPLDLLRELRELKPTVVHFSGHGAPPAATMAPVQGRDVVVTEALLRSEPSGVVVNGANGRSQVVTPEAIAQTLDAVGAQIRLVVLNACYSASIADALLAHVDCVVGMSDAIHDTDDAHRDPVPGFEGRWLAGFAPVGDTGFVVIVQTRYDAALGPNTRLSRRLVWRGSAAILAWLAACGTLLWVVVFRRRPARSGS